MTHSTMENLMTNSLSLASLSRLGNSLRAQTKHASHGLSLCTSLTRSRSALDGTRFLHQCRLKFGGSATCCRSRIFRRREASRGRCGGGRAPEMIRSIREEVRVLDGSQCSCPRLLATITNMNSTGLAVILHLWVVAPSRSARLNNPRARHSTARMSCSLCPFGVWLR